MRTRLLLITFLFTAMRPGFVWAQSLAPTSIPNSSRIDLKGLTKKASSGSTESQVRLGFAYQFGEGVDKDINEAIRWYRMAANHGDPMAQNNLGYLYETGPDAIKDIEEAGKWYMRAAVYGNPQGQLNLGLLYLRGEGV